MSPRSRDRMAVLGPAGLDDGELIDALCSRTPRARARISAAFRRLGSLGAIADATGQLLANAGLTRAEARRLLAAAELSRRLYRPEPGAVVLGPADVFAQARDVLGAAEVETLVLLCLNRRNAVIARDVVSSGSAAATVFDARTILKVALRQGASAIALAHNHPSGDPTPSPEDVAVTRDLARACELLRVPLIAHVVVAGPRWRSIAAAGHLRGTLAA